MNKRKLLIDKQMEVFANESWSEEDLLPFSKRRDNTFGQYVANVDLILLEPFMNTIKGSTVLTICDGRGVEASYLKSNGLYVTATDLFTGHLNNAKKYGFIDKYAKQNAEELTFADEEFDWGFVKAGLHHLPRPAIGIYELLRISKKGVFILEGHDGFWLSMIREKLFPNRDWETSGNYVYRFKKREVMKICLGLDMPCFAIKTTFLPWSSAQEKIKHGSLSYKIRHLFYKCLNYFFSSQGNLFTVIIFKVMLKENQKKVLEKQGFKIIILPRNPYL